MVYIVMNNGWGISTSYESQFGDRSPIDRARAFGIQGETVDGNDPVASWYAIERGMTHVTHLFNAMTQLHHRGLGVAGCALDCTLPPIHPLGFTGL